MKITLYATYLIHDIDQWTYRLANMRVSDVILKDDAQSDVYDRRTDASFYRRKIEDGVAHLGVHLAEELVNAQPDATDKLELSKAAWEFTFKEDTGITANSQAVAELMHRFVVMHVLRDWAAVYAPDSLASINGMLDEAESELDEGMYSLDLPIKHRRPIPEDENEVEIG